MFAQRITGFILLTLLLWAIVALPGLAFADGPSQAGLVVQFGDGGLETLCLDFEKDEIKGVDLLARSGLDVIMDTASGMGVTICQIEEQGCAFPAEHCFCNCMGSSMGGSSGCAYWNYYYRDPGEADWTYSPLGAALRKVKPGSVEAWVWGDGHTPPADDLTFEAICATPTPTSTPAPATTSEPPTFDATITPTPTQSPTTLPTATVQPSSPSPSPVSTPETGQSLVSYWPFGLMVIGLVAIGAIVWLRRA